jgi:hypothetical protein
MDEGIRPDRVNISTSSPAFTGTYPYRSSLHDTWMACTRLFDRAEDAMDGRSQERASVTSTSYAQKRSATPCGADISSPIQPQQ